MDQAWPASDGEAIHTTTHLGNPPACAMALAALEIHSNPSLAIKVRNSGEQLKSLIEAIDLPTRGRIRGRGLLLGVEILSPDRLPDRTATSFFHRSRA